MYKVPRAIVYCMLQLYVFRKYRFEYGKQNLLINIFLDFVYLELEIGQKIINKFNINQNFLWNNIESDRKL